MVKAFAAAVAAAICAATATADSPTFRFFGSAGDEGQWRVPRETSPLNPGNFLNLRRAASAADVSAFTDVALPGHADKLHAKLRASSVSAESSSTKLTV